jgi:hypothetical protein
MEISVGRSQSPGGRAVSVPEPAEPRWLRQVDVARSVARAEAAEPSGCVADADNIVGALPFSIAPAIVPAILALGGGSYGVLYAVAGLCAVIGAFAVLPVKRVR